MSNKINCKKCGSNDIHFIAEPIEMEKRTSMILIIGCVLFALLTLVGVFLVIKAFINIQEVTANLGSAQTIEEGITEFFKYQIELQKAKNGIYTGLIVSAIGLIPLILLLALNYIAPKYDIRTKTKAICQNCGRKWDFKDEIEKDEIKELKNN